jgi:hypothetical protein
MLRRQGRAGMTLLEDLSDIFVTGLTAAPRQRMPRTGVPSFP